MNTDMFLKYFISTDVHPSKLHLNGFSPVYGHDISKFISKFLFPKGHNKEDEVTVPGLLLYEEFLYVY